MEFKFEDHFKPCTNGIIFKEIAEFELGETTESGLIIGLPAMKSSTPESDLPKNPGEGALGVRIVAIGPDVTRTKPGDRVMLTPNCQVVGMDLFGDKYFYCQDYNVMALITEEAAKINEDLKKDKEKKEASLRAANLSRMLAVPEKSAKKVDIN